MSTVDITVYGAGAYGLSVAYDALTRGAKVRVIDPNGVAFGASGGIVGALAPHTPEKWEPKKQFQLDSLLLSRTHWPKVEEISGLSTGYGNTGRLLGIPTEHQLNLANERTVEAKLRWQGQAEWHVIDADEAVQLSRSAQGEHAEQWAPKSPTGKLVYDTLSARIHPKRACAALAAAIKALGGEIVEQAAPEGKVVHATGWWGLTEMSERLGQEVGNGEKGQAVLLEFSMPDAPQIFASGVHFIPHNDGTMAIGSTTERYYDDGWTVDAQADDLLARAIKAMPLIADAPVLKKWAGLRPRSATRAPMLGADPHRKGEFVCNGGFKIGFGMAPLAARVLNDLVLEDRNTIPEAFKVEANL